jgi:alkylated DNA repair dioxygenase AlkB
VACELGLTFDSVLANRYRDGRDSMGWHSDDEKELGPDPVIASVSLGAGRRFRLRHRSRPDLATLDLVLEHGSLLVMQGATQHHWKHCLPRTARPVGERINLTFRRVLRGSE